MALILKARLMATCLLVFIPVHVLAQNDGRHKDLLIQALRSSASGNCPATIMSPMLQDACERQMPNMANSLRQLGSIKSAAYRGEQQSANGLAEVYRVTFERGTMTWMINTGQDGKIFVLWSGG